MPHQPSTVRPEPVEGRTTRVAIVGGSGYGAAELLRLLLPRPDVRVEAVLSRGEAGRPVAAVHKHVRGLTDLCDAASEPASLASDHDAVFLSVPHGEARKLAPAVRERCPGAVLIDLSQDFRTDPGWVYGLTEHAREDVARARSIANPGCFATGLLLGVLPALASGLVPKQVIVDAKTGSSGSGAEPSEKTHHPERVSSFFAYKVFAHAHEAEVGAAMGRVPAVRQAGTPPPPLAFVPQSAPLVRGIAASCYLVYPDAAPLAALRTAYDVAYARSPFVRIVDEPPNVRDVLGTNNADVFHAAKGSVALVLTAIDNLGKGMAGQAVQNMNVALGLPEDAGLRMAGLRP